MTFSFVITADTIISAISALSALAMFIIAYISIKKQIQDAIGTQKDVLKARRIEQIKIALDIETQIKETSLKLAELSFEIEKKGIADKSDNDYLNVLIDKYLCAVDMLCYCINKNYFDDENDWKNKYADMISGTIKNFETRYGEASPYRNTKEVYRKWCK